MDVGFGTILVLCTVICSPANPALSSCYHSAPHTHIPHAPSLERVLKPCSLTGTSRAVKMTACWEGKCPDGESQWALLSVPHLPHLLMRAQVGRCSQGLLRQRRKGWESGGGGQSTRKQEKQQAQGKSRGLRVGLSVKTGSTPGRPCSGLSGAQGGGDP